MGCELMFRTRNTVFRNVGVSGANEVADLGYWVFTGRANPTFRVIRCVDAS